MDSVSQLRTIDSKGQGAERENEERAHQLCKERYGLWWLCSSPIRFD